jgi:hypothetical protein
MSLRALWLIPLVKDKFVSKFEYNMEQSAKKEDKLIGECWDMLKQLISHQ